MNEEMKKTVLELLYKESEDEILKILDHIESSEILYIYAYNYNWDNGFRIPEKIISKKKCDLSIALMIFYKSDGFRYLQEKNDKSEHSEIWINFTEKLYFKIVNNNYQKNDILFEPPLNKVQIYKLKKILDRKEYIFIESIGEKNLNIIL